VAGAIIELARCDLMARVFLCSIVMAWPVLLALTPGAAEAQLCAGPPARPGQVAVRAVLNDLDLLNGLLGRDFHWNADVIASGELPQRVWGEAGWGYRSGPGLSVRTTRQGGIGYSIATIRDSIDVCPFVRLRSVATEHLPGEPGAYVLNASTRMLGVAAARRPTAGAGWERIYHASLTLAFHRDTGVRTEYAELLVGVVLAARPVFVLGQLSLGKELPGPPVGALRVGFGMVF
jgi:hypothetical protein